MKEVKSFWCSPCNEKFKTDKWNAEEKTTAIYAIALHSCGRRCAAFVERIRIEERYSSDLEEFADENWERADEEFFE